MKIAIIGTRGIPNNYGGFEQLAEYLSVGLSKKGHHVFVYSPNTHKYKQNEWNGVNIIRCYDPENKIGTAGQFIYDFNCILDSRKRNFDAIINLGYTSSSVWMWLFPRKTRVITNMDGLEWKRSKYSARVQQFLLYAEKLAVKRSHALIADSPAIKDYLFKKYGVSPHYIAYGSDLFTQPDPAALSPYKVKPFGYNLLIARMEPENNIETILDGLTQSVTRMPFLVVGNTRNKFGAYLVKKFSSDSRVHFTGPVYQPLIVNNLRYYCNLYFHGHSVGGTNPSLLEAMACKSLVAAHNNEFNRAVLGENAHYFSDAAEVKQLLDAKGRETSGAGEMTETNFSIIKQHFNWPKIVDAYEKTLTA